MNKKRIAVTGAAGVLGQAVSKLLVDRGHEIIAIDKASETPNSDRFQLSLPGVDLTDGESVRKAFSHVSRVSRRLDGLANIAGGFRWEKIEGGNESTWDLMYKINVRTAFLACRAAIPLMKNNGGAIVNVSAAATLKAGPGNGAYAAAKSGVSRLTEALAEEVKDNRIRVNAVLPSILDTPANRIDLLNEDFERWVRPQSLAGVIAFLLSEEAEDITGSLIPVRGRVLM